MLVLLTLVIMGAVGFSMLRLGILQALVGLFNTIIAGLLAFALWPVIAPELESALSGSFLDRFEDALALMLVFLPVLGGLRAVGVSYFNRPITLPLVVDRGGSVIFGIINGYLLAGFLIAMMQTLPWKEDFLNFTPTISPTKNSVPNETLPSRVFPPDAMWIKLAFKLHKGSMQQSITTPDSKTLLQFEYNTAAYRRYLDGRPPLPYPPPAKTVPKKDATLVPKTGVQPNNTGTPLTPVNPTATPLTPVNPTGSSTIIPPAKSGGTLPITPGTSAK